MRREFGRESGLRCLALAMVLSSAGCREMPFRQVEMCSLDSVDPIVARDQFQAETPSRFALVNSVVFEYLGRRLSLLGMIAVDAKSRSFRLVGLNPMGVTMFDISGNRHGTTCEFALEGLIDAPARSEDLADAMGTDVRRMYFDLIPPRRAAVRKGWNSIVFLSRQKEGAIKHRFAGHGPVLIEKQYYEDGSPVCRVRYYEYENHGDYRYPAGIILDNQKYGYRLVVRLREIREVGA